MDKEPGSVELLTLLCIDKNGHTDTKLSAAYYMTPTTRAVYHGNTYALDCLSLAEIGTYVEPNHPHNDRGPWNDDTRRPGDKAGPGHKALVKVRAVIGQQITNARERSELLRL